MFWRFREYVSMKTNKHGPLKDNPRYTTHNDCTQYIPGSDILCQIAHQQYIEGNDHTEEHVCDQSRKVEHTSFSFKLALALVIIV